MEASTINAIVVFVYLAATIGLDIYLRMFIRHSMEMYEIAGGDYVGMWALRECGQSYGCD